jgi:hypothetical protein
MKKAIKRKIYFLFLVILFFINLLSFGFISVVKGDSWGLFSDQSASVHEFVENQNSFIQGSFLAETFWYFWWVKPDHNYYSPPKPKPSPPPPPPAKCSNLHNTSVDEKPTSDKLCKSGTPSIISSNDTSWTWDWTCSGSDIVSCQAYRNAQCNPTFNHQYMSAEPTGNLCDVGDKSAKLSFDGAKWSWNCKANESEASCETYKNLNCRLQPSQGSICPDDDLEVTVEDLVPPKENERLKEVSWAIPGVGSESGDKNSPICESFSPDFTQAPSGTHSINYKVLDIGAKEAGCFTSVYVKEPSCSIILDSPSTEMSVGSTLKLTIKEECITPVAENPYALQVLLQGTNDEDSYEFSQEDLNDDGTVDIKIKKAGNFTFKAAVNGENGSVSCSSQISAFTEGSEWWERKPE